MARRAQSQLLTLTMLSSTTRQDTSEIDGPVLEEQKAAWEQLLARWPELERNLMQINEQIEFDPKNSYAASLPDGRSKSSGRPTSTR